jgi:hypothetical protein
MVVGDVGHGDGRDPGPVESAIGFGGRGFVIRLENEAETGVEIDGEFTLAIVLEFMAAGGVEEAHVLKSRGGIEFVEAQAELFRTRFAETPGRLPVGIAKPVELPCGERYPHLRMSQKVFTDLVKKKFPDAEVVAQRVEVDLRPGAGW